MSREAREAREPREVRKATRLGRYYWRLWWASTISSTGDGAFVAALPLLAVTITRDPRLVAVLKIENPEPRGSKRHMV